MNTNYLYYQTPINDLQTHYGADFEQPFKHKITTQLPKNIVLIRLAATVAFGALLALTAPAWMWPVVVIGAAAYAGWTIYSHLLRKDPLVEFFYKVVGGKDQYDDLPEIVLVGGKTVQENIMDLNWDNLDQPAYRIKTDDGRRILIVRALTRNPEQDIGFAAQVKTIFGFVEKLGPADLETHPNSNLSPENERLLMSVAYGLTGKENTFGDFKSSSSSGGNGTIRRTFVLASIENSTVSAANEFLAQMK